MKRLPNGAVKIYESCLNIHVERSGKEINYKIPEKKKASIYGLSNGNVLIRCKTGSVLKGIVKFRGYCMEIRAIKGKESLWPGEFFKHPFKGKSKAAVYSLENGDVMIRSLAGVELWKHFDY